MTLIYKLCVITNKIYNKKHKNSKHTKQDKLGFKQKHDDKLSK